jgi:ubiquinone/menaquinone biosynthesis C-methylase UbiE
MSLIEENITRHYQGLSQEDACLSCGELLPFLELRTGERLLDLGCGVGREALAASRIVGDSGRVIGIDLTPEMIQMAFKTAKASDATNLKFMVGNMEDLQFENAFFNAVISNCAINHARNKDLVFQEIYRVLKPGGRIVIADAMTKKPLPAYIKNDPEQWAACFGGALTEQEFLDLVHDVGFQTVEVLKRREYIKNGFDFISLTIRTYK